MTTQSYLAIGRGFAGVLILASSMAWATSINVNVGGAADIYLAGQPTGTNLGGFDTAPTNSPLLISGITLIAGHTLTFSATGSVGGMGCGTTSADGSGCGVFNISPIAPALSLSSAVLIGGSLIGVFLDDNFPSGPAPPGHDWTGALGTAAMISPALREAFFIGDGLTGTGSGSPQSFVVPTGATRLFLGVTDDAGASFNNFGSYSTTVSDGVIVPGVPEPATWLLLSTALCILTVLRRGRMRRA